MEPTEKQEHVENNADDVWAEIKRRFYVEASDEAIRCDPYTLPSFLMLTEEQQKSVIRQCDRVWSKVKCFRLEIEAAQESPNTVQDNPECFWRISDPRPHFKKLVERYAPMTQVSIMHEMIADVTIVGDCLSGYGAFLEAMFHDGIRGATYAQRSVDYMCEHIKDRLDAIRDNPVLLSHVPKEDEYIWDRLRELLAMSKSELWNMLEAEHELL